MADSFKWGKDLQFKIDNAAGTLTAISDYMNNVTLGNSPDMLDVTPLNSTGPMACSPGPPARRRAAAPT